MFVKADLFGCITSLDFMGFAENSKEPGYNIAMLKILLQISYLIQYKTRSKVLSAAPCKKCALPIGLDSAHMVHREYHWHATESCFYCENCQVSSFHLVAIYSI